MSCSSEKPADIAKGKPVKPKDIAASGEYASPSAVKEIQYSLEIIPEDASCSSTLSLTSKGFNLSDAKIEWLVNGNPAVSDAPSQFKASGAKKGDTVQAKAIVKDREILSNIVKLKNAAPEITRIKIMPETFKAGDTLYVDVTAGDRDGDEVTILHEWTKNGQPAGTEKHIGIPIKRGDKIIVRITPFDGESYGKRVVLHREILNMPPMIVEDKNSLKHYFDGKRFSYQVKAEDPDGDALAYSLKTAPAGMTINPATGLIQWNVPADFKDKAEIKVSVSDGFHESCSGGH
ncbi:MAG: hypothetical protein CVV37_05875 [Nitrospira bacterium HGW-Nitrospira-1]|nr:MAG: hypothetical protein CVV37_05875 [Nitrospira bacterium HGW-Nitrospira-1]